jgi:hypothetical protein
MYLLENTVRTITLDGIVGDPAQHCELGSFSEPEAVAHPREEMRETVMASSNALGDASASTGEGQCPDAVRT